MRPVYAKAFENYKNRIFEIRKENQFSGAYHFHSECQLTHIIEGNGGRYIGNQFNDFEADELTFIGPGLPHVWYHEKKMGINSPAPESLTLFFHPDAISSVCSSLFDITDLSAFLARSKQGMLFYGATKSKLKKLLRKMLGASDIQKTACLFESLAILLDTDEYTLLSSEPYLISPSKKDGEAIDNVYNYVFKNFENNISLEEVARLANLTKPAFCRFFKARTKKTFSQFVNEVRIQEACRLLGQDENQITHIAYACGFNSLPNFNKFFKSIKSTTPSDYKSRLFV